MISDVRHLNFVPDENHLSVTFSAHARPAEFRLTDEQVVLLWEQLGVRVAKLARRRPLVITKRQQAPLIFRGNITLT
jgi:hypothetical protein